MPLSPLDFLQGVQPTARKPQSLGTRLTAALLAYERTHPAHVPNFEETSLVDEFDSPSYLASFTKGMPHDPATGLLARSTDYDLFRRAITTGREIDIRAVPLGPLAFAGTEVEDNNQLEQSEEEQQLNQEHQVQKPLSLNYFDRNCSVEQKYENGGTTARSSIFMSAEATRKDTGLRAWESMAAGLAFDLQGPDAQAVTMPPAPTLSSAELAFEMSEVYWMALLRDVPFQEFNADNALVRAAVVSLNAQPWIVNAAATCGTDGEMAEAARRRAHTGPLSESTVFRGALPGDNVGPYLSQFLLAGTDGLDKSDDPADGRITFGSIRVDQRVRAARTGVDFMTSWGGWLDAQNGADLRGLDKFVNRADKNAYRFIATPRDLATYVHYDALYEAYLNACLMLLALGAPFDSGLPFTAPDAVDKQTGFATFGGPHILSLVTEVATRALKAVRFQKFNVHRRARPEAVAARIDAIRRGGDDVRTAMAPVKALNARLDDALLQAVFEHNKKANAKTVECSGARRADDFDAFSASGSSDSGTYLLPMAYAEGSPMHPAYGAGHATVAGACVTVLKAFFDTEHVLPFAFEPAPDGSCLVPICDKLTVGGELNKVCSNISIGRNWAGVHYYSDYIESVRMGEEIAIGILQEQKLTFGESFTMTVPLFDGSKLVI